MEKSVSSPPTKEDSRLLKRSAITGAAVLSFLAVMHNRNNKSAAAVMGALVGSAAGALIGLVFGEQLKGTVFNNEFPFKSSLTAHHVKAQASGFAAKLPKCFL